VRDYFINQQFHRDVFVKGPRRLSRLNQMEALTSQAFVLTSHPDNIPMKVKGALVIELLADENFGPKSIGQLSDDAKPKSVNFNQPCQALLVLSGADHVHPAQQVSKVSRQRCAALNQHICDRARNTGDIGCLASPVTGSGVPVGRFQQLFLLATHHGRKTVAAQAKFAWKCISSLRELIIKEGTQLKSVDENIAELTQLTGTFNERRRPLLKALGIE
jgi:hypothetical protein